MHVFVRMMSSVLNLSHAIAGRWTMSAAVARKWTMPAATARMGTMPAATTRRGTMPAATARRGTMPPAARRGTMPTTARRGTMPTTVVKRRRWIVTSVQNHSPAPSPSDNILLCFTTEGSASTAYCATNHLPGLITLKDMWELTIGKKRMIVHCVQRSLLGPVLFRCMRGFTEPEERIPSVVQCVQHHFLSPLTLIII